MLAEHPFVGRPRPEFGQGVRSFPVGNYLIFYTPSQNGIDVARVIYGGRDLPGEFRDS
jgi:toxin ParE1/3/4